MLWTISASGFVGSELAQTCSVATAARKSTEECAFREPLTVLVGDTVAHDHDRGGTRGRPPPLREGALSMGEWNC